MESSWNIVGILIADYAQGPSGMLSNDILSLVKEKELSATIIKGDWGYSPTGGPGTKFLFGSREQSVPITIEVVCPDSKLEEFRMALEKAVKAKGANALVTDRKVDVILGDPDIASSFE